MEDDRIFIKLAIVLIVCGTIVAWVSIAYRFDVKKEFIKKCNANIECLKLTDKL